MRRVWMLTVVVLAAALLAAPAFAQSVRGPVTAIGQDTLTVTAKGQEYVFKIEPATQLIARGAGTAAKTAEEKGKPGPKLADFVKVGQHVEVKYKEAAGAKVATEVRPVATTTEAVPGPPPTPTKTATGTVVSVTEKDVVVKVGEKDTTFAISPKTKVTGKGGTTKTQELKEAGKPTVITEFLKAGDRVTVTYEEGATPTATSIRVTQKALK